VRLTKRGKGGERQREIEKKESVCNVAKKKEAKREEKRLKE